MDRQRAIAVAVVIGILPIIVSGCVSTNRLYPAVMEKITGVWQNTEYNGREKPAKRVINPDGVLQFYENTYDATASRTARFSITKAWTDESNRLWFTSTVRYDDSGEVIYELSRVDADKMDMNILWSNEKYPKEWDPVTYPSYFYRK